MDPVDEFAQLKAEIRRLQERADTLRDGFLRPGARLRSNRFEVSIKRSRRRCLCQRIGYPRPFLPIRAIGTSERSKWSLAMRSRPFVPGMKMFVLVE